MSDDYTPTTAQVRRGYQYSHTSPLESAARFRRWLAAHDAEVERVTAEKCAQIAEDEHDLHVTSLYSVLADARWENGGASAADQVARSIRHTFGLAPDEKGGE